MTGDDGDRDDSAADGDRDDLADGLFLAFVVLLELVFLGWILSFVVRSLLWGSTVLDAYSVGLRLVAAAFLVVEMLVPVVVFVDLLRRPDDPDFEWLHVTLLPLVNLLGALAYFEDRRRKLEK